MRRQGCWTLGAVVLAACSWPAAGESREPLVIEAEKAAAPGAEVFHDVRASGKRSAGVLLTATAKPLLAASADLPGGDYVATFWLEAVPADLLHHLAVTLRAGDASITLGQIQFDPRPGYQPFELRFLHEGGRLALEASAVGGSGFDGMRKSASEGEKADLPQARGTPDDLLKSLRKRGTEPDEELESLEEGKDVRKLTAFDYRLLCDNVEIRPLRLSPALVTRVEVDKVHYFPGETVKAKVWIQGDRTDRTDPTDRTYRLVAEEITEVDAARQVFEKEVRLGPEKQAIEFEFKLGDREFGHELRCSLVGEAREGEAPAQPRRGTQDGSAGASPSPSRAALHSRSEFFGVSQSVFRIGISGAGGGQDMRRYSEADAERDMQALRRAYANYFERFAWAPCDYSNLAPETEIFYSGQTQYPGSILGFRNLIRAAHRLGVRAITYGKACAAGIAGFLTFQRHPEFFGHRPEGPACEAMSVFYLERMLANDYNLHAPPSQGGWQHWASLWTDWSNPAAVEFGAEAIVKSVEMFGWDGVRWDGHFVGKQQRFLEILKAKCPRFVHGYNIAFANPGSKLFLPPDQTDFHEVAAHHGLLMDESTREWSHSNYSPGHVLPFYEAVCREADYERRIGGLPLFMTFDMGSKQDITFDVLCGLAAGQRYAYLTSPGDFAFGPLPKFLTRYSAFVWDDTKGVAQPERFIEVKIGPIRPIGPINPMKSPGDAPFWRQSVWLRELPDGRQQLLINLLNPPNYTAFASRVQPPPKTMANVAVRVATPAGAKLTRAVQISPDLTEGHLPLTPVADGDAQKVVLPRLRTWSILVLEYEGGPKPLFPLTTPVEDATAELKRRAEEEAKKKGPPKGGTPNEEPPKGGTPNAEKAAPLPHYRDYEKTYNADLEAEKKIKKPADMGITRNGMLDLHHARGAFSWVNPLESAVALLEAGRYTPSWVDFVGFKLGPNGCMDEFPDAYEPLLECDVLALDDVHAFHLGAQRRAMIADFVRGGGGLLYFGGYWNLSLGADHNTYLAELLPVRIRKYRDIACDNQGLLLKAEKPAFFGGVDWSKPLHAFTVDTSPLKEGAEVLVRAGGKPAIVASSYGKGRVIAVLVNPCGDPAPTAKPYWESPQWPRVLAACVKWLGQGSDQKADRQKKTRATDPTKPLPQTLSLEAADLDSTKFTARLKEAMANAVDAESARALLEAAVDNVDKIEDAELLADVAERARPYFDQRMAKLGERLLQSPQDFLRQAGYQILGMAGDRKYRITLEKGLEEKRTEIAREAIIGLARMGDPEAAAAIRKYLETGTEKLLALTALVRLGQRDILPQAIEEYEHGLIRRVRLKCGRGAAINTLWGGVSFKLTPAQRKQAMAEYRKVLRLEAEARHDVAFFSEIFTSLPVQDLGPAEDFLVKTETRELVPTAFALLSRLPTERAKAFRARLAEARLPELRLLAKD